MSMDKIREALEGLVKGKDFGTFEVTCEADDEDELQAKVDATDDLWRFAREALAELDKPVLRIESFAADRERKAREDAARKCAEAAVGLIYANHELQDAEMLKISIFESSK